MCEQSGKPVKCLVLSALYREPSYTPSIIVRVSKAITTLDEQQQHAVRAQEPGSPSNNLLPILYRS